MPDPDCEVRAGGDIIFRVDGGAAVLQLNRPAKRNALSQAMWEAICAALAEAAARPDVRAFVFTGLPGVFCAGADLTALRGGGGEAAGGAPTGRPPPGTAKSRCAAMTPSGTSRSRPLP